MNFVLTDQTEWYCMLKIVCLPNLVEDYDSDEELKMQDFPATDMSTTYAIPMLFFGYYYVGKDVDPMVVNQYIGGLL